MKFSYLMLYVNDIEEHIRFYRDILGLEEQTYYEEEGGMDGGSIKVAFMVQKGKVPMVERPMIELVANSPDDKPVHRGYEIGILVDSCERTARRLEEAGYPLLGGPVYRGEGQYMTMEYAGPEGTRVAITEYRNSHLSS